MSRKILYLAAFLAAHAIPASADAIYNYEQRWMLDTDSGLYWQVLQIPTATFVPSHGSIATYEQILGLSSNLDFPNLLWHQDSPASAYSRSLANLLTFFATNAPAQAAMWQPDLSLRLLYSDPTSASPDRPLAHHEFAYISYVDTGRSGAAWLFRSMMTIGSYGPGFHSCPEFAEGCPSTLPALVVSTVQPVPLPAAAWLLLSGVGALARFTSRLRRRV